MWILLIDSVISHKTVWFGYSRFFIIISMTIFKFMALLVTLFLYSWIIFQLGLRNWVILAVERDVLLGRFHCTLSFLPPSLLPSLRWDTCVAVNSQRKICPVVEAGRLWCDKRYGQPDFCPNIRVGSTFGQTSWFKGGQYSLERELRKWSWERNLTND